MERRVFTYKDVEEASSLIGKMVTFTDNLRDAYRGRGIIGILGLIDGVDGWYQAKVDGQVEWYQFISVVSKAAEKWVPFTAEDWELFLGKAVREFDMEGPCGSIVTSFGSDVLIVDNVRFAYRYAFERLVFMDGSRFGKKVTE